MTQQSTARPVSFNYPKCQHCGAYAHYSGPLYHGTVWSKGEDPKPIRIHGYCIAPALKGMAPGTTLAVEA